MENIIEKLIFELEYLLSNVYKDIYNYIKNNTYQVAQSVEGLPYGYFWVETLQIVNYDLTKIYSDKQFNKYDIDLFLFYFAFVYFGYGKLTSKNNIIQQYKKFINKDVEIRIENFVYGYSLEGLRFIHLELIKCLGKLKNTNKFHLECNNK